MPERGGKRCPRVLRGDLGPANARRGERLPDAAELVALGGECTPAAAGLPDSGCGAGAGTVRGCMARDTQPGSLLLLLLGELCASTRLAAPAATRAMSSSRLVLWSDELPPCVPAVPGAIGAGCLWPGSKLPRLLLPPDVLLSPVKLFHCATALLCG